MVKEDLRRGDGTVASREGKVTVQGTHLNRYSHRTNRHLIVRLLKKTRKSSSDFHELFCDPSDTFTRLLQPKRGKSPAKTRLIFLTSDNSQRGSLISLRTIALNISSLKHAHLIGLSQGL